MEINTRNLSNTTVPSIGELLKSLQDRGKVLKPVGSEYQTSPESTLRQHYLRNQDQGGIHEFREFNRTPRQSFID
jgi:hypothetical protein